MLGTSHLLNCQAGRSIGVVLADQLVAGCILGGEKDRKKSVSSKCLLDVILNNNYVRLWSGNAVFTDWKAAETRLEGKMFLWGQKKKEKNSARCATDASWKSS